MCNHEVAKRAPAVEYASRRVSMRVASTDLIEKKVLLRAPRARVWRALSYSKQFGEWFGVRFDDPFKVGALVKGVLVGTNVDEEVGKAQQPHRGLPFEITIDRIEPER